MRARHRLPSITLALLFALGAGTGLAACGDDDGADVREIGDEGGSGSGAGSASGSGSGSASGVGSGSASGVEEDAASGSASGTGEQACSPVGEDLEGDAEETVEIQLDEYAFIPPEVEVSAGVVTFATTNVGEEAHELAFLPGGGEVPFTEDGAPDEEALAEAGAFELEAYGPGQDCNATYELEAGEYTMFCIVEAPDGETHYEKGMAGTLTVG